MNTRAGDIESKIKSWLFPSLVTILSALIWKDVSELREDVKALLAQSNVDKTRIDNIEREIYGKKTVFSIIQRSSDKDGKNNTVVYNKEIAIVDNRERKRTNIYLKKTKNVG